MSDKILEYFDEKHAEIQKDYVEILAGTNAAYQQALFELHEEITLMMAREKLLEVLGGRAAELRREERALGKVFNFPRL